MFFSFFGVVPLGSIKELPADSCSEIKASEGNEMVNRKYWIYSDGNGEVIEAYCEGKMTVYQMFNLILEQCKTTLPLW